MSVVTVLPECKHGIKTNSTNTPTNSMKSMNSSLYSTSSVKFSALNRRKGNQRSRDRNPSLVPAVSEIKQRVISARLLRMKQLQNQIGEAHHRISELASENRLLKSLHKRQDSALSKYESSSAELPQLLHSHAEEVRVWQSRCRNLQHQNKELMGKIKQKDTIILAVTDQNKHLLQLNKDKNLEEREKLADRVQDLEQRLLDKDNDMKLLARRLQLDSKAFKSNLNLEQQKYRDLVSKIELSDFMLQRSDNGDKKSSKPFRQNLQAKSPPRNVTSKSASSLTNGSETSQLILPPCENGHDHKKSEDSIKNNFPRVNNNVKLLPTDDDSEVDLTKIHSSDKAHNRHADDEITVTIRNGMNRAKLQQKTTKASTKLSPLHPKQETKKSSDDSEFSDSDFQFFSEHNGTKMAHNARDLLEHKMHLSELESKMKNSSLDHKKHATSSSSSSLSEHHQLMITAFDDIPIRRNSDVAYVQGQMRDSMMRRESFLDEYCDTLVDGKSVFSDVTCTTTTTLKKLEHAPPSSVAPNISKHVPTSTTNYINHHGKSNGNVITRKTKIDSNTKNTLLATLKHIDDDN